MHIVLILASGRVCVCTGDRNFEFCLESTCSGDTLLVVLLMEFVREIIWIVWVSQRVFLFGGSWVSEWARVYVFVCGIVNEWVSESVFLFVGSWVSEWAYVCLVWGIMSEWARVCVFCLGFLCVCLGWQYTEPLSAERSIRWHTPSVLMHTTIF